MHVRPCLPTPARAETSIFLNIPKRCPGQQGSGEVSPVSFQAAPWTPSLLQRYMTWAKTCDCSMLESEGPLMIYVMTPWSGSFTGFLSHHALSHPWVLNSVTAKRSHSLHKLSLPVPNIGSGKGWQSSPPRTPSPKISYFPHSMVPAA